MCVDMPACRQRPFVRSGGGGARALAVALLLVVAVCCAWGVAVAAQQTYTCIGSGTFGSTSSPPQWTPAPPPAAACNNCTVIVNDGVALILDEAVSTVPRTILTWIIGRGGTGAALVLEDWMGWTGATTPPLVTTTGGPGAATSITFPRSTGTSGVLPLLQFALAGTVTFSGGQGVTDPNVALVTIVTDDNAPTALICVSSNGGVGRARIAGSVRVGAGGLTVPPTADPCVWHSVSWTTAAIFGPNITVPLSFPAPPPSNTLLRPAQIDGAGTLFGGGLLLPGGSFMQCLPTVFGDTYAGARMVLLDGATVSGPNTVIACDAIVMSGALLLGGNITLSGAVCIADEIQSGGYVADPPSPALVSLSALIVQPTIALTHPFANSFPVNSAGTLILRGGTWTVLQPTLNDLSYSGTQGETTLSVFATADGSVFRMLGTSVVTPATFHLLTLGQGGMSGINVFIPNAFVPADGQIVVSAGAEFPQPVIIRTVFGSIVRVDDGGVFSGSISVQGVAGQLLFNAGSYIRGPVPQTQFGVPYIQGPSFGQLSVIGKGSVTLPRLTWASLITVSNSVSFVILVATSTSLGSAIISNGGFVNVAGTLQGSISSTQGGGTFFITAVVPVGATLSIGGSYIPGNTNPPRVVVTGGVTIPDGASLTVQQGAVLQPSFYVVGKGQLSFNGGTILTNGFGTNRAINTSSVIIGPPAGSTLTIGGSGTCVLPSMQMTGSLSIIGTTTLDLQVLTIPSTTDLDLVTQQTFQANVQGMFIIRQTGSLFGTITSGGPGVHVAILSGLVPQGMTLTLVGAGVAAGTPTTVNSTLAPGSQITVGGTLVLQNMVAHHTNGITPSGPACAIVLSAGAQWSVPLANGPYQWSTINIVDAELRLYVENTTALPNNQLPLTVNTLGLLSPQSVIQMVTRFAVIHFQQSLSFCGLMTFNGSTNALIAGPGATLIVPSACSSQTAPATIRPYGLDPTEIFPDDGGPGMTLQIQAANGGCYIDDGASLALMDGVFVPNGTSLRSSTTANAGLLVLDDGVTVGIGADLSHTSRVNGPTGRKLVAARFGAPQVIPSMVWSGMVQLFGSGVFHVGTATMTGGLSPVTGALVPSQLIGSAATYVAGSIVCLSNAELSQVQVYPGPRTPPDAQLNVMTLPDSQLTCTMALSGLYVPEQAYLALTGVNVASGAVVWGGGVLEFHGGSLESPSSFEPQAPSNFSVSEVRGPDAPLELQFRGACGLDSTFVFPNVFVAGGGTVTVQACVSVYFASYLSVSASNTFGVYGMLQLFGACVIASGTVAGTISMPLPIGSNTPVLGGASASLLLTAHVAAGLLISGTTPAALSAAIAAGTVNSPTLRVPVTYHVVMQPAQDATIPPALTCTGLLTIANSTVLDNTTPNPLQTGAAVVNWGDGVLLAGPISVSDYVLNTQQPVLNGYGGALRVTSGTVTFGNPAGGDGFYTPQFFQTLAIGPVQASSAVVTALLSGVPFNVTGGVWIGATGAFTVSSGTFALTEGHVFGTVSSLSTNDPNANLYGVMFHAPTAQLTALYPMSVTMYGGSAGSGVLIGTAVRVTTVGHVTLGTAVGSALSYLSLTVTSGSKVTFDQAGFVTVTQFTAWGGSCLTVNSSSELVQIGCAGQVVFAIGVAQPTVITLERVALNGGTGLATFVGQPSATGGNNTLQLLDSASVTCAGMSLVPQVAQPVGNGSLPLTFVIHTTNSSAMQERVTFTGATGFTFREPAVSRVIVESCVAGQAIAQITTGADQNIFIVTPLRTQCLTTDLYTACRVGDPCPVTKDGNILGCVSAQDGPYCTCQGGWSGPTCAILYDACTSSPCYPGVPCVASNLIAAGYTCTCPDGFFPPPPSPYEKYSCLPCPAGQHSNASYSPTTSCLPCPAGTAALPGSSVCDDCRPGYYSAADGSATCSPCNAGQYASGFNATSCSACPAGMYCPMGSTQPYPAAGANATGLLTANTAYVDPLSVRIDRQQKIVADFHRSLAIAGVGLIVGVFLVCIGLKYACACPFHKVDVLHAIQSGAARDSMGGMLSMCAAMAGVLLIVYAGYDFANVFTTVIRFSAEQTIGVLANPQQPLHVQLSLIGTVAAACPSAVSPNSTAAIAVRMQSVGVGSAQLCVANGDFRPSVAQPLPPAVVSPRPDGFGCQIDWACLRPSMNQAEGGGGVVMSVNVSYDVSFARALLVSVQTPHLDAGSPYSLTSLQLPPPLSTPGASADGSDALFQGPAAVDMSISMTATVYQLSTDPTANSNPLGFSSQISSTTFGPSVSVVSPQSNLPLGVTLRLTPVPGANIVSEVPSSSPVGLLAQILALVSGALTGFAALMRVVDWIRVYLRDRNKLPGAGRTSVAARTDPHASGSDSGLCGGCTDCCESARDALNTCCCDYLCCYVCRTQQLPGGSRFSSRNVNGNGGDPYASGSHRFDDDDNVGSAGAAAAQSGARRDGIDAAAMAAAANAADQGGDSHYVALLPLREPAASMALQASGAAFAAAPAARAASASVPAARDA